MTALNARKAFEVFETSSGILIVGTEIKYFIGWPPLKFFFLMRSSCSPSGSLSYAGIIIAFP